MRGYAAVNCRCLERETERAVREANDAIETWLWRGDGDSGEDEVYRAVVATHLSNGSAEASMTRVRRPPNFSFLERNWQAMLAWRDLFQRHAISRRSKLVFALAYSAAGYKAHLLVHDLLPFEAADSFAREKRYCIPDA